MGGIVSHETHEKRSFHLPLALQSIRKNSKLVYGVAIVAFSLLLIWLLANYASAAKQVTIIVDGQEQVVETDEWNVQKLLQEQRIALGEHDRVTTLGAATVEDGDQIVIERAIPVQVVVGGQTEIVYTFGDTVSSALQSASIELRESDQVTPAPDAPISANDVIQVVRINTVIEEQQEQLPFEVVKQNDPQLLKGKEQIVQKGQEGLLVKTLERVYEDGNLISEKVLKETVLQESKREIVAVGTKSPVVALSASSPNVDEATKDGVTFAYKQVLNNVTLVAYSAGVESTGKDKNHPHYGMTASGTRVTEGRTIAVDPKVIPLGWWVYIEGLGFRRAEDTGGGVKGNMIDVYYDDVSHARKFGMKRGYKVYIIGKENPLAK